MTTIVVWAKEDRRILEENRAFAISYATPLKNGNFEKKIADQSR